MSRLSEAVSFVNANNEAIGIIAASNDPDIFLRSETAIVVDSNMRILLLLAEIADAVCPDKKEVSDDN